MLFPDHLCVVLGSPVVSTPIGGVGVVHPRGLPHLLLLRLPQPGRPHCLLRVGHVRVRLRAPRLHGVRMLHQHREGRVCPGQVHGQDRREDGR